jgi:hypothetical protein
MASDRVARMGQTRQGGDFVEFLAISARFMLRIAPLRHTFSRPLSSE